MGVEMPFVEVPIPQIRSAMGKAPKLKLKAAEARYTVPIVRHLLMNMWETSSEHSRLRLNCLDAIYRLYSEMDNWCDSSSPQRFLHAGREHLILYGELRNKAYSLDSHSLEWKLYPKHHLLMHLLVDQKVNPKRLWAYMFESEIGDAAKSAKHLNVRTISYKFMEKYLAHGCSDQ